MLQSTLWPACSLWLLSSAVESFAERLSAACCVSACVALLLLLLLLLQ
jgi:hypothetical protein